MKPILRVLLVVTSLVTLGAPAEAQLLHHWKLDETVAGPVVDSEGGDDGTNVGATINSAGILGPAYDFDASVPEYVQLPDKYGGAVMSVSAWVNPIFDFDDVAFPVAIGSASDSGSIFDGWALNYQGFGFQRWVFYNSGVNAASALITTNAGSPNSVTPGLGQGQWMHLVGVADGVALRLYVNGVLQPVSVLQVPYLVPVENFRIGDTVSTNVDSSFDGRIDDVAIFGDALTTCQVLRLYQNGLAGRNAASDRDTDGTIDVYDDCQLLTDVPVPLGCNTDGDCYGNCCDGDFDNNEAVDAQDFVNFFLPCFLTGVDSFGVGCDMNCDGVIDAQDFASHFLPQFLQSFPGP